jgi:cytochrome oxidase Cu insertion factor (SCO1/SenC/PrrC family)
VISRSGLESQGAEGGGYLQAGDWTASIGVRHVYSHVHFSGKTQNVSRTQLGTEVQSKTNIDTLTATYQLTPRISLTGTLPFVYASRRQQSQYGTLYTSGIGDISLGAQYWVRSPKSEKAGLNNVQAGLSLLLPSGNARQNNVIATAYGATPTTQYPDYSVQPGAGTWGMIMSWQGFQDLGRRTIAFVDGSYVMTQGGYHNFWTAHGGTTNNAPNPTPGMTQFDAIQDQYMLEVGASHPAPGIKGLGMTLALRAEGVPAHNLIGNDLGFRRPGFGLALTPGAIYTRGNHMLQFSVGKVLVRDRTRSHAEEVNGTRAGDAAFANYVWMGGYTLRMPRKKDAGEALTQSSASRLPKASQAAAENFKPFSLKTLDGKRKTLQDFSNKVTLVTFFFPRCPYCNVELPEIQKIYDKYKDKGLSAVWVNILPEETGLIAGWQLAKNLNVPVLVGASQESLQRDYNIDSTPSSYLLDENSRVLFHQDGYKPGDEKTLEARIAAALGIAPASTSLAPCPAPTEERQPATLAPRILDARPR